MTSTTAQKSVTTPIPVQLSATEFTAFIFPHLSMPKRGPKCKLGYHRLFGSVSKVEMATPIDLIYKVYFHLYPRLKHHPPLEESHDMVEYVIKLHHGSFPWTAKTASLWISMPPSHRLPSRLIPASDARPRGARPRERD